MRTLLAFATAIFFLSPLPPMHIDYSSPVAAEVSGSIPQWPLLCDSALPNKIYFHWIAIHGEAIEPGVVEDRLHIVAEQINWLFWRDSNSHTETRLPAWAVTADCKLDVLYAPLATSDEVRAKLIEITPVDFGYCGLGPIQIDSRPGPENKNNQSSFVTVSRRCVDHRTVAHELLHGIGAVQMTAPNGADNHHSAEYDIMSNYPTKPCGEYDTIDCDNDDYFSLRPSGYLAEHWNSADSIFLVSVKKHTVMAPLHMR